MLCPKCGKETELEGLCPQCLEAPEETAEEVVTEETAEVAELPAEEPAEAVEETSKEPAEAVEETSEEAAQEVLDEVTEEVAEETEEPAQETEKPKKKRRLMPILAGVVIALLVVIVACLGLALRHVQNGGKIPSLSELRAQREAEKFDSEAAAVVVTDQDGTVSTLNNAQLSFYYWGEYYYFINAYGFSFDATLPLEEQVYETTTDSVTGETTATTWHQYFLESACYSINQVEALKTEAQKAGFEMTETYLTEYNDILTTMPDNAVTAGFVDENGVGDVEAYIKDSYGSDVTVELFEQYLYDSYYASSYSESLFNSFQYTDEEKEAYFDENVDYFLSYGIEKSEYPNVHVRHILIEPAAAEDGTITDEAWDEAEAAAEELYEQWQEGDATEDSFATLANENSVDPGSNTTGGLYENVYPGQMVTAFNDWCFDQSRQTGDSGVVKTEYGFHIMYFVEKTDSFYWKDVAESELRYYDGNSFIEELALRYTTSVEKTADIYYPDAVKTIMGSAATEAVG